MKTTQEWTEQTSVMDVYQEPTRLWVDYTNWKGRRAWREIESISIYPLWRLYFKPGESDGAMCWTVNVKLVDRRGNRTLRLTSIHGFYEGDTPPEGN